MFLLRFDMRAPDSGAPIGDLYRAAIDMCEWGEKHGCISAVLSEHHSSPDGYNPSPLVLASAIVSRTTTLPIQIAAILVNFYDPVRLAEDMAVLDIVSGGRVSYVLALGYRPEEYAMFGEEMQGRGRRMEKRIEALQRAWSGEPFDFEGRPVRVTPRPITPGGPTLFIGGGTPAAARRAARLGLGLLAQTTDSTLAEIYHAECATLGREPGTCIVPPPGTVPCAFVAEDVDRAWEQIGPHLLHDARMYASWLQDADAAVKSRAQSVDALRASPDSPYRIFTPEQAADYIRTHGVLLTQPLCGGTPPDLAWESLHSIAEKVLPAV